MKKNYFYILVFGVHVIVCLPQSNNYQSSLISEDGVEYKDPEDERELEKNNLKNKEENATSNNITKNELQEITQIVDLNEKTDEDVWLMNEGIDTDQRPIPIYYPPYYGQAEHDVPRRWLPAPPRYLTPLYIPRASEPIMPTYGASFEKDVHEAEVVVKSNINEAFNKHSLIKPVKTAYVAPQQITSYTQEAKEIMPNPYPYPYYAPVPVDPTSYNPQQIGPPRQPLVYPPRFVQPGYFQINGPQPYDRYPVNPLPRYPPVKIFQPSYNYGTVPYQKLLQPTISQDRPADIQGQKQDKIVKDFNDEYKQQFIVRNTNRTVKANSIREKGTVRNTVNDHNGYRIFHPPKSYNADELKQNFQLENNLEFPDIDTTVIPSFVESDTFEDVDNMGNGHSKHFFSNLPERDLQVINSQNPEPKEKSNIMVNSNDTDFSDNVTQKPINKLNYQVSNNSDQNSNIINTTARQIIESLADRRDMYFDSGQIIQATIADQDLTNESKNATANNDVDTKQEFENLNNTKQHESQESLDVTNIKYDETKPDEIRKPEIESNEPTMESQAFYSNGFSDDDSIKTTSTKAITKMNDDYMRIPSADIDDQEVTTLTPLQPNYDNEIEQNHNQELYTLQIDAPLYDTERNFLNDDNKSETTVNIATEYIKISENTNENSVIDRNKINLNQGTENNVVKKDDTLNDVQPIDYIQNNRDDGDQISETDINQAEFENSIYAKSLERNIEEYEKINSRNDEEDSNESQNAFTRTKFDNRSGQESDRKSDNVESQIKGTRLNVENNNIHNKNRSFENTSNKNSFEYYNNIGEKEPANIQNSDGHTRDNEDTWHIDEDDFTTMEQKASAYSTSDIEINEDNEDSLNGLYAFTDDFDEISSVSQTANEESIKSKLGFKTTCIRHPVNISMNDDNPQNAAESLKFGLYRKLFDEYVKNHKAVPLTIIQKDIKSFVYKNGTVVDDITIAVWNVENGEKPVEIMTSKIIKQRKRKISKRNRKKNHDST